MPLRLNNTLKQSHFQCKNCHAVVEPPRMPLCEIAAKYGQRIEATVKYACLKCGKRYWINYDSAMCDVKVVAKHNG